MLRGNHGSGKSTAVKAVVARFKAQPVFGVLGFKAPEAYLCGSKSTPHLFNVLGPYETDATCGFDYMTKLGVKEAVKFLERYNEKGDMLFESIMTSVRILEPSIGVFIKANKDKIKIVTLTTTMDECAAAIEARQKRSIAGTRWNAKHLAAQQRQFENVTRQYEERGFDMTYVSRDEAPVKLMSLLARPPSKPHKKGEW
jgi:hypothetical protein